MYAHCTRVCEGAFDRDTLAPFKRTLSLSAPPSLSWIIQKPLSPKSSNSYLFICIPGALQNDWPAITDGEKKRERGRERERNVPQTICFKMRQEWFCSFQRRRQAPVHNDVSVMGWQIDWKIMTLAWETHQWAAAQLWSQRALRHTFWTSFVLELYKPTNEDTPCFQAGQYTISIGRTRHLMTEGEPLLPVTNPPPLVLLVKRYLNHGWMKEGIVHP